MTKLPWFQKKTEAPKSYEVPIIGAGYEVVDPEENTLSAIQKQELYITNAWVRKYINAIVRGCIKYKLQAVPVDGADPHDEAIKEQIAKVNKLLTYSNESETFTDVREKYLKDLVLHGNGVLELAPRNGNTIKQIYAAPGYLLRAKMDKCGNLVKSSAYYFLDPQTGEENEEKPYSIDDLVHFKLDQLSDRFYGISPLEATYRELNADQKAAKEMSRGDFGMTPQVIAVPKQTKGFVDLLIGKIQQTIAGKSGNKVIAVSSEQLSSVKLANKEFKDEFEFQKWLVQRHNVYGIPPYKLGFVSETGSMSAKEQREDFLQLVETFVTYECEKLSFVLCYQKLKYENVKIVAPALITRLEYEKARVLDRLVSSGIITPNEARIKFLGMPGSEEEQADRLQFKEKLI